MVQTPKYKLNDKIKINNTPFVIEIVEIDPLNRNYNIKGGGTFFN